MKTNFDGIKKTIIVDSKNAQKTFEKTIKKIVKQN